MLGVSDDGKAVYAVVERPTLMADALHGVPWLCCDSPIGCEVLEGRDRAGSSSSIPSAWD